MHNTPFGKGTLRLRLAVLFAAAAVLHSGLPILLRCLGPPHEALWLFGLNLAFCALVMVAALALVTDAMRRIDELADLALKFGNNPDMLQEKLPERGPAEVRRAAQAFNGMYRQIRSLLRERDDMVTALSHDIRTPLARILMALEMMEDTRLAGTIEKNIGEIASILEKGMALARNGLSAEEPCLVDLASFTENFVEEAESSAVRPVYLGCLENGERICVRVRPSGLEICLRNLVSNAAAYGGNHVEVRVSADAEYAYIDVVDDGPGIPDCCLTRVMQPFFRLETSRNKNTGGLGLGLSIARNAAGLDGGEIRLSNRKQGGLQARLKLPRVVPE